MSEPRNSVNQAELTERLVRPLERATERVAERLDTLRASSGDDQVEPAEQPKKQPSTRRGLGRVYKRGNVWWVQYSYRGKKHRESSGSVNHADAVRLLKKRLGEIGRGRLVGPSADKTTFGELVELIEADYRVNGRRSLDRVQLSIRHLRETFPDRTRVGDITTDRARGHVIRRLKEGASNGTVNRELTALKRMLRLGVKAGKVAFVPEIENLREENARKGFFEEDDLERVKNELPQHLRPVVEFACLTGWRIPSEILPLRWAQVDMKAGVVRLEPGTTKNDEGRTFPFDVLPELRALIERQRQYTKAVERRTGQIVPWVFHNEGKPMQSFYKAWHSACRRAATEKRNGLEVVARPHLIGRIPHDFRRTAVRNLVRAGVPEHVAMKLTGHRTAEVFHRYDIVVEQDLRDGLAKLAAHRAARQVLPLPQRAGESGLSRRPCRWGTIRAQFRRPCEADTRGILPDRLGHKERQSRPCSSGG